MILKTIKSAFVQGTPKAQPRPRAVRRGNHAGVYNPKTADAWKSCVKREFADVAGLDEKGAVEISIEIYFKRPKSHFGTGRNNHKMKPSAPILHTQKPDVDNLAKSIIDALVDINVIHDDSQVITLTVCKLWCGPSQVEGARVAVLVVD